MRRVVVTGIGAITPCGLDAPTSWRAVVAGRSGVGPITRFDADGWPVRIAAEVKGFDPEVAIDRRLARRIDLFTAFGVAAADEAVRDAGLEGELGERAGVYLGSGIGGIGEITDGGSVIRDHGHRRLSPFFIPKSLTNLAAGNVAMRHGASGPSLCISTACATGNHCIGEAWRAIRMNQADVVIAGGTEAAILPLGVAGFMVMKALSRRNDEPTRACRPFDVDRDGFVMGEGAGVIVLEALETARARGARIYAELVGYGLTNDAYHITAPPPGHEGAARCMRMAIASAGLRPDQIDYVNAHGTSTPSNDVAETEALHTVFGDHAARLMVSSTKSMTGHLLGAAGGVEAIFAVKALHEGTVPPTINLDQPGPGCDLDYVPGQARQVRIHAALSNAFGFGGTNASLVFQRFTD